MGKREVTGVDMKYSERENDRRYVEANGSKSPIPNENDPDKDYVIIDGVKVPREEVSFESDGTPVRKVVGQEKEENER